ncbi:uncharacterized protein K460DRAFT_406389 [Cucurbitaria berberidis CBS 394.84]|uniref:Zn(2)-C6 fungal-type domain-containing protein n=1 Tax=Cucurbitaria berberidis CBS 394.84 TaxID=1168544 RepID=A0A9P4GIB2_9PLEO|nr:uncharacterized protein K460DRAFT_406389 [Cucurbitaria berberidis CBS 394.84]KAF1846167.1 hypothetical protein K460DRAFT_406389 [Cucurbitaria berberidis CBS 394.84]
MQSNMMASSSEDGSQQPRRLPVNPRRHKVAPEQRKRVVRACNRCNSQRARCSGEQPCQRCSSSSRACEYPAPEPDKTIVKNELDRLQKRCAALEKTLHAALPDEAADLICRVDQGEPVTRSTVQALRDALSESEEAKKTEGGFLVDGEKIMRFLGGTSGATFLDHLKRFMRRLVTMNYEPETPAGSSFLASLGKYQTFDSRPLPNPDVNTSWLPARADMRLMLDELREYVQDGNGKFLSGGIHWWGHQMSLLPPHGTNSALLSTMTTDDTHRNLAFYHVCFALASSVGHTPFRYTEQHAGEAYFTRARKLLGNPLDNVRYTLDDVPVLALMGFYLIELNRRDTAYMYVSLAVHIAIINGAFGQYSSETNKRVIWNLYIMDRWLSVLMGRPPTIENEAIKLPRPCDADSMPSAAGLCAHIDLARISGFIVCETYQIAARDGQSKYSTKTVDTALKMLDDWKSQLPSVLETPDDQDSACCTLHMAQNQLIVLTTRPIFLAAVEETINERTEGRYWSIERHTHRSYLQACSAAAHRNLILAQRTRPPRKFLQAGLHFVFNAAVILLLDRLLHCTQGQHTRLYNGHTTPMPSGEDLHAPEIKFAICVFEQASKTGTNYPRDCYRILQDLRALIDHHLSPSQLDLQQGIITGRSRNHAALQVGADQFLGPPPSAQRAFSGDNHVDRERMTWVQRDSVKSEGRLLI